jgi:threonine/homoserine/homoserine lactone efflux protein
MNTRLPWVLCSLGVLFILVAAALTVADLVTENGFWPVNIITFACGGWVIYLGLRTRGHDRRRGAA